MAYSNDLGGASFHLLVSGMVGPRLKETLGPGLLGLPFDGGLTAVGEDVYPGGAAPAVLRAPTLMFERVRWGVRDYAKSIVYLHQAADGRSIANRALLLLQAIDLTLEPHGERVRIRSADGSVFGVAAHWRPQSPRSLAILTCPAEADLAGIMKEQPIMIRKKDEKEWLNPSIDARHLLAPLPAGALIIDRVSSGPAEPTAPERLARS